MFIKSAPEGEAEGSLREIYEGDRKSLGYVPNHARVFSLRPEVLQAWRAFQGSIRKNLPLRRYELVTLAAAKALNCRYCLLAHGKWERHCSHHRPTPTSAPASTSHAELSRNLSSSKALDPAITTVSRSVSALRPRCQVTVAMSARDATVTPSRNAPALRERRRRGTSGPETATRTNEGRKIPSVATKAPVPP